MQGVDEFDPSSMYHIPHQRGQLDHRMRVHDVRRELRQYLPEIRRRLHVEQRRNLIHIPYQRVMQCGCFYPQRIAMRERQDMHTIAQSALPGLGHQMRNAYCVSRIGCAFRKNFHYPFGTAK